MTSEQSVPFVSVILPVLNGAGRLEHALAALNRLDYPRDRFEIIVADGRSTDATRTIAESMGCRVVDNPGVTVAAGRNAGIQVARGDLIAFSEDDIVVPPGWLTAAVAHLQVTDAAGVGGPTPLPENANHWSQAVNAVFRLASNYGASVQSDRLAEGEVKDLPGGNAIYRAATLRAVGPIDESLTTAEDVDLHQRIRQAGGRLFLTHKMTAEHRKRDSVRGFYRQIYRFSVGRVQLSRKTPSALSALHRAVAWLVPCSLVLFALLLRANWLASASAAAMCALGVALLAMRRGEAARVALLLPPALLVFAGAWAAGYWSEKLVPCEEPTRPGMFDKLRRAQELALGKSNRLLWTLGSLLAAWKLYCLIRLAWNAPFVMDEFQQGGQYQYLGRFYWDLVPFKTVLFNYFYSLARILSSSAPEILLSQRMLTVGLVLASLAVLFRVSRKIGHSPLESALVLVLTLSFSTFIERCFRLRAEPLALLFALLALGAAVEPPPQRRAWARGALVGLFLGGAFLCTQKSVWFGVSLSLGFAFSAMRRGGIKGLLRECMPVLGGGLLAIGLYSVAFPPATPSDVLAGIFLRSTRFAIGESSAPYQDLSGFIVQTWQRNIWLYSAGFIGFFLAGLRTPRESGLSIAWIFSAGMAAFILSWKEPWPYVFTWLIPFVALWIPAILRVTHNQLTRFAPKSIAHFATAALALGLISSNIPRDFKTFTWTNQKQLKVVALVESLLLPEESYQDGIGMVSTRPLSGTVWWDASAMARIKAAVARGDSQELQQAFQSRPKVLIHNYRLDQLRRELYPFVAHSYFRVHPGLSVAGTRLQAKNAPSYFEARWYGRYHLIDADGLPLHTPLAVDNVLRKGAFLLSLGPHSITAMDDESYAIVPADVVGRVRPDEHSVPVDLFSNIYVD